MSKSERLQLPNPNFELAYWNIFRSQKVSLKAMREQAPLSATAAKDLVRRGDATAQVTHDENGETDILIFMNSLVKPNKNR